MSAFCIRRKEMKKKNWSLILLALCLVLAFSVSPVEAAKEKETICDDTIDNDGDGKTDCDDPNCNKDPACAGGGDDTNPLTATFREDTDDRILDDRGGDLPRPYIDGVDNVRVRIGRNSGRLFINIAAGSPNKPPVRKLFFDFCDNEFCDNCASFLPGDPPVHPAFRYGFLRRAHEHFYIHWHRPDRDGPGRDPRRLEAGRGA